MVECLLARMTFRIEYEIFLNLEAESLKKCRQVRAQVISDSKYQPLSVFELLLFTAELELKVREMFRHLFTEKRVTWERSKANCVGRLSELADVFGGEKPLSRVEKNGIISHPLRFSF